MTRWFQIIKLSITKFHNFLRSTIFILVVFPSKIIWKTEILKFKRSFCITRWFQIKMLPTTKFHNFSRSTIFILVICSSNIVLVTLLTNLIVDTVFWHVSKMVVLWRRSCRFERNQNMHSVRVCRLGRSR